MTILDKEKKLKEVIHFQREMIKRQEHRIDILNIIIKETNKASKNNRSKTNDKP